eukprot:2514620-Amphidinium_carterae.2
MANTRDSSRSPRRELACKWEIGVKAQPQPPPFDISTLAQNYCEQAYQVHRNWDTTYEKR